MAKNVIKTQVFDSSRMKMQKVNNCFNSKRQEHAREKVFDVKDGQVQKSDGRPGVSDHARVGGGEAREMGRRTKMESKSGNLDRVNGRRDSRSSKCDDNAWQLEREVVKDRLHVSGIPPEVCEQELGDFFSTFGRVSHVAIIPVRGFGQKFFPSKPRYGFVTFFNGEVVVHHILKQQSQREAMVLRGYKLHVSPARERRHEVLERCQVEGKEVGGRQGVPPAPGSSRDWMREQPSWRQMDGQGRAFPGNGNLAERRGRGEAVQGNNLENREQVQQQIVGCFPQQVDHLSSNQQVEATPAFPIQQFAGESSLPMAPMSYPLNQRVFPVTAFNEGFAPGAANYFGTTPIIIYQPNVPAPQPPLCYTGALPMPYYTPMSYHEPESVAQNPCLTQHSELAPIYANHPQQGELPQQHHAWQEVCYLAPNPNVPQPWFTYPTMEQQQQQYNSFPQQPQASPAMFSDAASSAYLHPQPQFHEGQLPQSHIDNLEQVDISSLSLTTPEEVAVENLDLRNNNGSSKGEWRPRLEPSSL